MVINSFARLESNKVCWLAPQLTENKPNKNNYNNKKLISNPIIMDSIVSYLIIVEVGPLSLQKDNSNAQLDEAGAHPDPWDWKML